MSWVNNTVTVLACMGGMSAIVNIVDHLLLRRPKLRGEIEDIIVREELGDSTASLYRCA